MNAFINEFHYDNDLADAGEFIEVAGAAGTDLTGWKIELYNGTGGALYDTILLSGVIPDLSNGFGVLSFLRAGIQNGSPDGFALIDNLGAIVEFLSYEGSFTATSGAAVGLTSVDVGVFEEGTSAVGFSLQRGGTGSIAADFTFQASADDTPGAVNTGQTFEAEGTFDLQITEIFMGNEPGANLTEDWFEITNTGTVAWTVATDGALYFDDDSAAAANAAILSGIQTIAAGESVVFVNGDAADVTAFTSLWGAVFDLDCVQIGTHGGPGLGQGGDAVTLFLDDEGDGVDAGDQIDLATYPDANTAQGGSFNVGTQAFSVAGVSGAVATVTVNDAGQPAVGSPGNGEAVDDAVADFTLELLHFSDNEGSSGAIVDAPNMSAVLNALRAQDLGADGQADNTLTLASGDLFIPGVFFNASTPVFGSAGIGDIQILNELGVQASALGNHDFDLGTPVLAGLISGAATGGFTSSFLDGTDLDDQDFGGTDFTYLSSNLNFAPNANLAPLAVAGGQAPVPNAVSSSVVIESGGELIGVVGATTPRLGSISSPGTVGVSPTQFAAEPSPEELAALAAIIQTEVDALLAANPTMNKVVLLTHMQQIDIEFALAGLLENVDIIVAGGSNTRLLDDNDRPRDGDADQGQYPAFLTNAGGTTTAVVNTDGSYKYVGRLVIDFDADGNIIANSYDETVSGAYATDDEGVAALGAEAVIDAEVQAIAHAIEAQIIATESNVFGVSDVYLNGARSGTADGVSPDGVRTQETNLGNLTADANLALGQALDDTVLVSIKNGGGIRASIGQIEVPTGGFEPERLPNLELRDGDGNLIKPEGGISQNDIQVALAFNNALALVTVTTTELVALLEHGVSNVANAAGQFPQVAGVKFSYDPDNAAGDRILNAGVFDEAGDLLIELVRDGEFVGNPATTIRIVTLGFLAEPRFAGGVYIGGGDGYPFPNLNTNPALGPVGDPDVIARANFVSLDQDQRTGDALFADDGTEQDALAEYLADNFATPETAYGEADSGRDSDGRIQNVNFRDDAVFDDANPAPVLFINEIDSDTMGTDVAEFVEIYDGGVGGVSLDGVVLVLFNGSSDTVYVTVDLTGQVTDANGYFVVGSSSVANVDLAAFTENSLQNGADAVALYQGAAADFPVGATLTIDGIIDAVVYGTADAADTGLLTGLGETVQEDESANGTSDVDSLSRLPDGSGDFVAQAPTPGVSNAPAPVGAPDPANVLAIALAGTIDLNGAEIVDFDAATGRAFVTSAAGLQVIDASDLSNLTVLSTLDPMTLGFDASAITSVTVRNGIVAVSRPDATVTDNGDVLFFDAASLDFLGSVAVGALPDALKFNEAGTHIVVSNEGQSADGDNDPAVLPNPNGSVSIIALNLTDLSASTVTSLDFSDPSITFDALEAKGIRVNRDAPSAAADIEPEFATIEGNTAYIALQENNAVLVIDDITAPTVFTIDNILALGTKDHTLVNQGLDASDRDGDAVNIANYDIRGLFMPDGMDSYTVGGVTYFLTANEGDTRGVDEVRGAALVDGDLTNGEVDAGIGAELLAQLADETDLGRLVFSSVDGDTDGDGDIDELYVFGARSFSIFDEDGALVYDSGDQFEQITAVEAPTLYNSEEGNAGEVDNRSDNKGPEPEAVVLGEIEGRTYAFVALERTGGVMVYDVTDPEAPTYEQYLQTPGDFAPEGLRFITAAESPTGTPLLAISSEVSETLSFFEIDLSANAVTLISEIQGSSDFSGLTGFAKVGVNDRSALEGQTVTIEAIVTADFQGAINLNGFYVQEEDADQDGDAFTSEGLFISDALLTQNVNVGDLVRITGTVGEVFGQTQISASSITVVAEEQLFPTATIVDLGSTGVMLDDDTAVDYVVNLEQVEGMLVTFVETLTVAEMFNLDRFAEIRVSSEGRIEQYTQSNDPSVSGYDQHLQDVAERNLVLDDGSGVSNPLALEIPDGNNGVLDAGDSFRMGDTLTNLTGVVAYGFDEFRLNDATADHAETNPRPTEPADIGGTFKVASLNVLNYFTTLDTIPGTNNGPNTSGPNDTLEPRGANTPEEFERQAAKTVQAIIAMDADVLGLLEIENDGDIAVADLVARVNAELGVETYGYVETGDVGTDAITTAIIYKLGSVELVGDAAILTSFNGESFTDPLGVGSQQNRPSVAQTFRDIESGTEITVAVNHLNSKGSSTGVAADNDQLDGQGASNATRTAAAAVLAEWLASDPTGSGAENQLIIGDLNAYAAEDPITTLAEAGFVDVAGAVLGDAAYSYVFDGQIGTLDYVLANGPAFAQVAGATEWHINADEADALDYNLDFGRDPALYDSTTATRNSDHDPVIVSFDFKPLVLGSDGNDKLRAGPGGATLDGLEGDDRYYGGAGEDVLVLGDGDADWFKNFDASADKFDLRAWGVQSFGELIIVDTVDLNGEPLVKIIDKASGNVTRSLRDAGVVADDLTADNFIFAPLADLEVIASDAVGEEKLYGRAGDDRLVSDGAGANRMLGQGGADTFVIANGTLDFLRDFEDGVDLIDLSSWGVTDFADLVVRQTDTRISVRDGNGNMLRLVQADGGLLDTDLGADDFVFADTLIG